MTTCTLTELEVKGVVYKALRDALDFDEDSLRGELTLYGDLGMESIDSADVRFRIERELQSKLRRLVVINNDSTEASLDGLGEKATVDDLVKKVWTACQE